jgi:trehalose 6-phosphate phosphatase
MLNKLEVGQLDIKSRIRRMVGLRKVGLATDIDGTLSPIVNNPNTAFISERARYLLRYLKDSGCLEVTAVVTGRQALEARELVGIDGLYYIGNHGLETLPPGAATPVPVRAARPYQPLITSVLETLRYNLERLDSEVLRTLGEEDWYTKLIFENKGITASIHYRQCIQARLVRQLILQQLESLARQAHLRITEGRRVIEVRPPIEVNKGTAVLSLAELYRLNSLIYLGDDVTDVAAFQSIKRLEQERHHSLHQPFQGLTVGVFSSEMPPAIASAADMLVDGVDGVERFLMQIAEALNLS